MITKKVIYDSIHTRISQIKGDFRQELIQKKWKEIFDVTDQSEFPVASIQVDCTSGTYMRSLAHSIGLSLSIPALAWTIRRDRIGDYTIKDAMKLDQPKNV